MSAAETVHIVDITSGLISKVITYLEAVAGELRSSPELYFKRP